MEELVDLNQLEFELKRNGASNVSKLLSVDTSPAVIAGENYASILLRLQLKAISSLGNETNLSLILKRKLDYSTFDNDDLKSRLDVAYLKEYNVYTKIFPTMEPFILDKGISFPKLWPEFVASLNSKDLYLEDLKEADYRLASRHVGLDSDHGFIVFQSLGWFHAASYIAISKGLIDTRPFQVYLMVEGVTGEKKFNNSAYDFVADVILKDWGPEWKYLGEKVASIKHPIRNKVLKVGELNESRINVFNHGDAWVSNMMFKYNSKGKPTSLKFVDFQIPHYNSFAFDLSYFLNTSVSGEVKERSLDAWITVYCQSFSDIVEAHGVPLPCPTPELVRSELTRIVPFSINTCIRVRPIIMGRSEYSQSLADLMKNNDVNSAKRRYYTNPVLTKILKKDLPALLSLFDK